MSGAIIIILVLVAAMSLFLAIAILGPKPSVPTQTTPSRLVSTSTAGSSSGGIVTGAAPSSSGGKCPSGWGEAAGTIYDSWPKPGTKECTAYSGCKWAGLFKNVDAGPQNAKGPCKPGAKVLDGGSGTKWCRWPEEKVKSWSMASTWDKDAALLGKTVDVMVQGGSKYVRVNVGDVCADSDCSGCCSKNAGKGKYKLIDIEKWPAAALLGFNHSSKNFDVNNIKYPSAEGKRTVQNVIPLCYKIVGKAPAFK